MERAITGRLAFVSGSLGAGQAVLLTQIPVLLALTGISATSLGLLMAAGTAALMLASPLWGSWTDRHGPGRVVVLGLIGHLLAQFVFLLAVWGLSNQYLSLTLGVGLLALSRVAHGATTAGIYPACQTWTSLASAPASPLRALAGISAGSNLGRSLGPVLVLLALPVGELASFGWLLLLPVLAMLVALTTPPVPPPTAATAPPSTGQHAPWSFLLLAVLLTIAVAQVQYQLGLLLQDRLALTATQAATRTAWLLVGAAGIAVLFQLVLLRRIQRPANAQLLGALGLSVGVVLLVWANSLTVLFGAATLIAIGSAMLAPAYLTQATREVDESSRGQWFSRFTLAHTAGYSLGFVLAGIAYDRLPAMPLLVALLAAGLVLVLTVWQRRQLPRHRPEHR